MSEQRDPSGERLPRSVGLWGGVMMLVGTTIGSGIFRVPALVAERTGVLAVPLQAVVQRNGQSGVFVVKDGRAVFTAVTTGIIGGLSIEIEGVPEGTTIVTGPFQALRDLPDGAAVRQITT